MRARHDRPSVPGAPSTRDSRPANRAERRAAARGRDVTAHGGPASGPPASGTAGPGVQAKPRHTRTDYAARRSG